MARALTRILTIAAAAAMALPASALALAGGATGGGGGGGGFSGGGGSGGSSCTGDCDLDLVSFLIIVGLIAVFVGGSFLAAWIANMRRRRRLAEVEKAAGAANLDDGYWDPAMLKKRVAECFFPIQSSWEDRDVKASRPYVSDSLYERHLLQLEGLEKQGRRNRIQGLKLNSVELVRLHNITDDGEDRFVARIKCQAQDWVEDVNTGAMVNGSKSVSQFDQFWSFSRHPQYGWVLDEIQQASEGAYHEKAKLVNEDDGERTWIQEPPAAASASA